MTLTAVIILIIIGIILLLLEILVIPGVGVIGLIGGLLLAIGVFYAYRIDAATGHITLACTAALSVGMVYLSLRSKTWDRVSLKSEITGKMNVLEQDTIKVGDKGVAISRLAPMGKARINDRLVEVASPGDYVAENSDISVIKIIGNKIIVKQVDNEIAATK